MVVRIKYNENLWDFLINNWFRNFKLINFEIIEFQSKKGLKEVISLLNLYIKSTIGTLKKNIPEKSQKYFLEKLNKYKEIKLFIKEQF